MQLLFVFLITSDQLAIRQLFNPVTKCMPLVEFVVPPALMNISQNLIVEHDCSLLVVRRGKKLDHLPPVFFVIGLKVFIPVVVENVNC